MTINLLATLQVSVALNIILFIWLILAERARLYWKTYSQEREIVNRVSEEMRYRDSEEALKEKKAVDPECNPIEYAKICQQCEDKLTGHEDESGTLCRWCVTCTEVTEGESIASQADSDA